jgi:hypothetical protein
MSEKILNNTATPEDQKPTIYTTTYKKGYMIGSYHWVYPGALPEAVQVAKSHLDKRHLKHLHTTPFLIDLNDDSNGPTPYGSEYS